LRKLHIDWCLLALLLMLTTLGLVILYSASGKDIEMLMRQGRSFALGFLALLLIAQFNPNWWLRFVPFSYAVGIGLLIAVDVAGHNTMGATRWINLGGILRFQPAEFMKVIMPVTIAWYLSKYALPPRFKHICVVLVLILVPVVLIIRQPDLGTALLVLVAGAFVLFIAGLSLRLIICAFLALIPTILVMWQFVMHDYQKQRVITFLDPESDPLGSGWNIIQSKAAIGSGGIWGKGFLNGTQAHLDFLPESHTDFISAVLGEEFGLVGMLVLLTLYLLLISRSLIITAYAPTLFGKLLASSLALTFFIYVFVNIGMVSGLLPVVGVPLPFISYGGTHVVTLLASFGLIMAITVRREDV